MISNISSQCWGDSCQAHWWLWRYLVPGGCLIYATDVPIGLRVGQGADSEKVRLTRRVPSFLMTSVGGMELARFDSLPKATWLVSAQDWI